MHVTSKSRYAIKVVLDLCVYGRTKQVDVETIVRRQSLSKDYVSQILHRLRQSDLVISVRGRGGGYMLARDPMEISVWDIMVSVEDFVEPVKCLGANDHCSLEVDCIAKDAWSEIYRRMKKELYGLKIGELMGKVEVQSFAKSLPTLSAHESCGSV